MAKDAKIAHSTFKKQSKSTLMYDPKDTSQRLDKNTTMTYITAYKQLHPTEEAKSDKSKNTTSVDNRDIVGPLRWRPCPELIVCPKNLVGLTVEVGNCDSHIAPHLRNGTLPATPCYSIRDRKH